MATARIGYLPTQDRVATIPGPRALRLAPGVGHITEETLQAPTYITHELPAESVLYNDIEQLCNATLTIDKAFYDIGQKLTQATKEQKKCVELYKICYDLETRWKQHHDSYKKLLWRSREVAGKAQFAVDDFLKVFLPCLRNSSTTLPERQQLVQRYIQKLQEGSETSQNLSQNFLDFVGTLESYIADFSRAVEGLGFREQTEKCRILESKLHPAKAAMDCVFKEVRELGWKLAKDVVVTGITLVLSIVAPMWSEKLAEVNGFSFASLFLIKSLWSAYQDQCLECQEFWHTAFPRSKEV
ncbi:hypothetical protein PAXRUDRAFT_435047 [Paxillus rubicundulus Ve08.2h10]|uniref:Unplaced genomic scaffold scaffold_270, whole genome shotgun sequence n=1 Tax=Paxillus rubicundulus Ve08.2h10 TaxID=930991 RepID=A0A0D0DX92_9AGAM|nr:hypothetical protein PAXRUDRAFT_435047 [Paxillus rubicundulus Ve08.2h10]